ncbi:MAG: peptide deformylase [Victivallaceae bacterium]|nr:peptide deformylase [Victivallaceae bacterium]
MKFGKRKPLAVETLGSPVLRKPADPVSATDESLRDLAKLMVETMIRFNGIGLAAPQIGRSLRMVVLNVPHGEPGGAPLSPGEEAMLPAMPMAILNPEIIESSAETARREEGCLSVPGIWAEVERPRKIRFRATLLSGNTIEYECDGMLARCLQHEIDHLNGVVFIDRLDKTAADKVALKVRNLRREGGRSNYRRVLES